MRNLFCGIGESEILRRSIRISGYPFEPSSVHPNKEIYANEIEAIHLKEAPNTFGIGKELVFLSREYATELENFAKRNKIEVSDRASNWNLINEPFLDTEFDEKQKQRTLELLESNGISMEEVEKLRQEVGKQMYRYNFGTMLWEWCFLGLSDVLSSMRAKLDKKAFHEFYWRAMEIEQRSQNPK